jgi:CheY-like chemotaxis protein
MSPFTDPHDAAILIVDDQDCNVRLLDLALRRGGYLNVSSTNEPLQVCGLHQEHHYDAILLDIQMPRMNGFEVMAALFETEGGEDAAVLVLSADPSQRLPALEAGARDFLSKPLDLAEVLVSVGRLLEETIPAGIAAPLPPPATAPPPHVLGV